MEEDVADAFCALQYVLILTSCLSCSTGCNCYCPVALRLVSGVARLLSRSTLPHGDDGKSAATPTPQYTDPNPRP